MGALGDQTLGLKARQHNRQVQRMSQAERDALAQAMYGRLWRRYSRFYGAQGKPPPSVAFGPAPASLTDTAQTGPGPGGVRQVSIGPGTEKLMLYKSKSRDRRMAKRDLAHEWAHVYQRDDLLQEGRDGNNYNAIPAEHGAITFADAVMKRLRRAREIRAARKQGNRRATRRLRRKPLPALDIEQFGSNYGRDPTTILWPGGGGP